ncbi:prepilin-type N-terminal cleavage/methylation domain-containing protein [Myxococcota bacterium]|nr:prepilin-type N-terminal cleavage/methylation domain-containing protein [Myxococcota bacterium]
MAKVSPPRLRRLGRRGFTLVELLFVVTLILVISTLAFPSLRTFTARDRDASMATFVSHEFNRIKAQSQMRNRPYIVRFGDFNAADARGSFEIFESTVAVCGDAVADLAGNAQRLARYGFGSTPMGGGWTQPPGGTDPIVGLTGWRLRPLRAAEGPIVRAGSLTLCVRPDGSVHTMNGAVATPIAGEIGLLVQRFSAQAGAGPSGPARTIRIGFTQPARLELL